MQGISSGGVRFRSRLGGATRADVFTALVAALGVLALVALRAPGTAPAANAAGPSARAQLDQASAQMTAAIAKGFAFNVVARSTLYAKPGGPRIQVPDPADPTKVASLADSYYLGASAATGNVAGGDYFIQMYGGATGQDAPVDIAKLSPTMAGLVAGGIVWRNEGRGWYLTDVAPGIGLDPRTVALLPALLKDASGPQTAASVTLGGAQLTAVTAGATVADAPGVMAPDAASFTAFARPLTFVFDGSGRLAQMTATMRNGNVADFDLLVVTTITFDYDHPGIIPAPAPTAPPLATPAPDPTAAAGS